VNDADFFAGFLLLPPCAILEILSRKLWLLVLLARLLLRSRIVDFLMCSRPSFRLCRIGFVSGFALISFRCSSFSWPPLLLAGFGGATRGSVAR